MLTLEAWLAEIVQTNILVLLVGECGTGKQMFANRIHQLSERSEPLMKVVRRDEGGLVWKRARSGREGGGEVRTRYGDRVVDEMSDSMLRAKGTTVRVADEEAKPRRGIRRRVD